MADRFSTACNFQGDQAINASKNSSPNKSKKYSCG